MKNFTLLALSATIAALPLAANAQRQNAQVQNARKTAAIIGKAFGIKRSCNPQRTMVAGKTYQPGTVKEYQYTGSTMEYTLTRNFTYDQYGNVLSTTWCDADGVKTGTKYKYDTVETSYLVLRTQESYASAVDREPEHIYVDKRTDVTRNNKGQLTGIAYYGPNNSYTGLVDEGKIDITYGSDGKANSISMTMYDEDGNMAITLKDIIWETYNGNLLGMLDEYMEKSVFDSGNLIKSANVSMMGDGMEIAGTATGTYNGPERELALSFEYYGMTMAETSFYYKSTDDNGSYITIEKSSTMGTPPEAYGETVVYNDRKDIIEESESEGTSADDLAVQESKKYEYTYNESTGLADYCFVKKLDKTSGNYNPSQKLEFSNYKEIGAGITTATAATGKTAVYNTNGIYAGSSTANLPSGLYIVKQGAKSFKIMK